VAALTHFAKTSQTLLAHLDLIDLEHTNTAGHNLGIKCQYLAIVGDSLFSLVHLLVRKAALVIGRQRPGIGANGLGIVGDRSLVFSLLRVGFAATDVGPLVSRI